VIVLVSVFLAIVPFVFRVKNKKEWFHLALVVLVSGCPCALLLSTPVAMFCALSKAATFGVLFKGAEHLETLARIKIMALDKTGTITRGEFVVTDFKSLLDDDIDLNSLLYWISSIECKSSHPMADAVVEFARSRGVEPILDKVKNFRNFTGEGIYGNIDDKEIYIGNSKITSRAGCTAVPRLEGLDLEGKSVGYVFLDSSLAAIFCLSDICRTGAKEAIQELKSLGIKTVLLTGDCHGAANRAQEQLGGSLDSIHAELLPEDKSRIIKSLQTESPTAMVGDGLNDGPALATAHVGISMGVSGSALAAESGDIVLMSNDIRKIPEATRLAKRVRVKIIENVIISVSTKAAILGLAVAGHPLVWAAVLADVGTCLVVIFNSMLLLRGRREKKCCSSKGRNRKSKCSTKRHEHDNEMHRHSHDHHHNHHHNHHHVHVSDELALSSDEKCSENQCSGGREVNCCRQESRNWEKNSEGEEEHVVKSCLATHKNCCESYSKGLQEIPVFKLLINPNCIVLHYLKLWFGYNIRAFDKTGTIMQGRISRGYDLYEAYSANQLIKSYYGETALIDFGAEHMESSKSPTQSKNCKIFPAQRMYWKLENRFPGTRKTDLHLTNDVRKVPEASLLLQEDTAQDGERDDEVLLVICRRKIIRFFMSLLFEI
ncbi:heavy metal atpase 4, partial [Striga asiatica]